jgi:hypothetical protein
MYKLWNYVYVMFSRLLHHLSYMNAKYILGLFMQERNAGAVLSLYWKRHWMTNEK